MINVIYYSKCYDGFIIHTVVLLAQSNKGNFAGRQGTRASGPGRARSRLPPIVTLLTALGFDSTKAETGRTDYRISIPAYETFY
jgi:hypothetical protein